MPANAVNGAFTSRGGMQPAAAPSRGVGRRDDLERGRGEAVRQADRPAVGWRGRPAGERQLELRVDDVEDAGAQRHRDPSGLRSGARRRVRAGERAQRSRRREHHGGRSRFAARRQHGHAYARAPTIRFAVRRRAAAPDRLAHRARAQHSSAASRLDHEWRRRRRIGHGGDARDRREVRVRRSPRDRSSSSRTKAKKPGCSARAGSPIIRRFRSIRSSRRTTWTWSAKVASIR